jgi:prephenate dehydratase
MIGYLGPEGTFTHQALLEHFGPSPDARPLASTRDVLAGVASGELEAGFLPIENSIEGSVNVTIDALAIDNDACVIAGEHVLPITFDLLAVPGASREDIRVVRSHPHALAQCRALLDANGWTSEETLSTAAACRSVAEEGDKGIAAVAAPIAADMYGLAALQPGVADYDGAETRFIVIARACPPPTGRDRTSFVALNLSEDRPGSLVTILQELSSRGLNLTKVESRPMRTWLGTYYFFIEVEGHICDPLLADAFKKVFWRSGGLEFLGSYPRARSRRPIISDDRVVDEAEAAYRDAVARVATPSG